jgi:hypothetical protein
LCSPWALEMKAEIKSHLLTSGRRTKTSRLRETVDIHFSILEAFINLSSMLAACLPSINQTYLCLWLNEKLYLSIYVFRVCTYPSRNPTVKPTHNYNAWCYTYHCSRLHHQSVHR